MYRKRLRHIWTNISSSLSRLVLLSVVVCECAHPAKPSSLILTRWPPQSPGPECEEAAKVAHSKSVASHRCPPPTPSVSMCSSSHDSGRTGFCFKQALLDVGCVPFSLICKGSLYLSLIKILCSLHFYLGA